MNPCYTFLLITCAYKLKNMAATSYEIEFKNSSVNAYHFGVYQVYPDAAGLKGVVWQVRGLGPNSRNKVNWQMNYGVGIADWDKNDKSYSGIQIVPAELGNAYEVNMVQTDIPVINANPINIKGHSTPDDQINLHNNTSQKFNLGFALDGHLIAVTQSCGNQWAEFVVHPRYYVALYRDIKLGKLVDSCLHVGPVEIEFKNGNRRIQVECVTDCGRDILKPPVVLL